MELKKRKSFYLNVFFLLILVLYPLRHIRLGVDLWDAGYNYANFRYNGLEYMDSMWYFATWLANQVGSALTKLPFGNTVLGLNVYTALFVSLMAIGSYLFCAYRLKMPKWLVFVAEVVACSLCWAPTAILYHYLTYLLLLGGCICLYQGLVLEKNYYLLSAGILLGLNVAVRFSNLAQMGMVLVVWIYAVMKRKTWSSVMKETGLCVLGYMLALGSFLLFISIRYGLGHYAESVLRLFQMTEVATDYTPGRMLMGMVQGYFECSYWLKRFALMFVSSTFICVVLPKKWKIVKTVFTSTATVVLFVWLAQNQFYSSDYAIYQSIFYPCVALFALGLLISVYFLFAKNISAEDKLKALFVILLILIGTLGSNNAMYSSINNTFLVLPFLLYMIWKLCREEKKIWLFPMKCVMVLGVLIVSVQAFRFGQTFSYEEATGGRGMNTEITEIPVLNGMVTGEEKAKNLVELYDYLEENGLRDRQCILYGQIPAVSHYMELTPAMNIWSDLRSYGYEVMRNDLNKVREMMNDSDKPPLIIMEISWEQYMCGERQDAIFMDETTTQKLELLRDFIEEYKCEKVFSNGKFVVYK